MRKAVSNAFSESSRQVQGCKAGNVHTVSECVQYTPAAPVKEPMRYRTFCVNQGGITVIYRPFSLIIGVGAIFVLLF